MTGEAKESETIIKNICMYFSCKIYRDCGAVRVLE